MNCLKFKEVSNKLVTVDECLTIARGRKIQLVPCENKIEQQIEWDGEDIVVININKYLDVYTGYLYAANDEKYYSFQKLFGKPSPTGNIQVLKFSFDLLQEKVMLSIEGLHV